MSSSSNSPQLALPSVGDHLILSLPAPKVLMLKMNRPKALNAMSYDMEQDMKRVLDWFEQSQHLWVLILTGNGRGFCAGQDLKSFIEAQAQEDEAEGDTGGDKTLSAQLKRIKSGGFGGISTRRCTKPIIAAVDGVAMGGGTELVLNCDLVLATSRSLFALPEVARGVVAAMGGIPRIPQIAGHQRAAEMLLVGEHMSAQTAYDRFGFVNAVIKVDKAESVESGQAIIEAEALRWAAKIVKNSPDAVMVTKEGLNLARDAGKEPHGIDEAAIKSFESERSKALYDGDNIREGITAFFEKRKPDWSDPPQFPTRPTTSKL